MQVEERKKEFKFDRFPEDNIIIYVGCSLFIISFFNLIFEIPTEYVVSITFAGFFFVYADFLELFKKYTKKVNLAHSMFQFLGVVSLIGLPVLFLNMPGFVEVIASYADSYTILSLGIVLVIINLKSKKSRSDYVKSIINLYSKSLDQQEKLLDAYNTQIPSLVSKVDELEKEIKILRGNDAEKAKR